MKMLLTLLAILVVSRLEVPAGDGSSVTNFTSPSNYLTPMPATTNGVNTNTPAGPDNQAGNERPVKSPGSHRADGAKEVTLVVIPSPGMAHLDIRVSPHGAGPAEAVAFKRLGKL